VADNEGTRKSGNFWVVSISPDVCLTPVGSTMTPIPYQITAKLTDGILEAGSVKMQTNVTTTKASRIVCVKGDEAGTGGGVTSGVNLGYCRPITHSTTVRAESQPIVYRTSLYWMNCAGPDGPGNTQGEIQLFPDGAAPYAGPLVDLDKMQADAEAEENKSWWDSASDWVHTGLDIVGFIPGLGEIADGLNAAIYLAEGDYVNAAISAAAMVPGIGAAATGARMAKKVGQAAVEQGAKHLAKEAAERAAKEAAEKAAKEAAEKAAKEGAEEAAEKGAKKAKDGVEVKGGGKGDGGGGSGKKGDGGDSSGCSKKDCTKEGHPVDVATGEVIDEAIDISLPGIIPLVIERRYASSRASNRDTALGPGWAHSLEQWIEEKDRTIHLRDGEGRVIFFGKPKAGKTSFHRRERLELTVTAKGAYRIFSLDTRLTRVFEGSGSRAYLQSIEDPHGNAVTLSYVNGSLVRVVDTAARELTFIWDRNRLARIDVRVGSEIHQTVEYHYSQARNLARVVDSLSNAEEYEYDGADRMTLSRLKNGTTFQYEYDPESDQCVRTWGPDGLHEIDFFADQRTRTTRADSEEPKLYHWNDAGLVTREETVDGVVLSERRFDEDRLLIEERNGAGDATRYERDERGHLTRTIDPGGNATTWEFAGDLPVQRIGADGLKTLYTHDDRGNLVEIQYPSGAQYQLDYDNIGRLQSVRGPYGPVIRYEYDNHHNVVAETDARGARTTFEYDALGRATSMTDALGRTTRLTYDRLGRPVEIRRPDGTLTCQAFDARGNVTRVVDALGQSTTMEYGGTGVLTRVTQPDGQVWGFRYTSKERLREVENPRGEVYSFSYDAAGRVTDERTFDGRTLKYAYSKAGHLSRIDYPDGTFRAFNHDRLGNIIFEQSTDGITTFPRDAQGRLLSAVVEEGDRKVVTMFDRDKYGRVVTERQGDKTLRFEYDILGRRTKRILPNGSTTNYLYDALDELVAVEHDGYRLDIERDALGREVWRGNTGRVSIQSGYDAMDRLIEQRISGTSPTAEVTRTLVERKWSYDALGRVTEIQDGRWGTTAYRYDRIDQLLESRRGSLREIFAYDAAGSLRKVLSGFEAQSSETSEWEISPGNLLQRTETAKYSYDKRGRRVVKLDLRAREHAGAEAERTEYKWDCRDRLREVVRPDGSRVCFSYDAFGRRVRKELIAAGAEAAEQVVDFVWDGDELAADMERTRGTRVFVHDPETFVPLLQAEQGQVFAVVNDHLGMPKELVSSDGRVAWSAAHSAWGQVVEVWRDEVSGLKRPVESPFRLLGQYADDETGLCYTRFRYFDAEVGRWCSPDSLGFMGGQDLVAFDGSPSVDIDPLGLKGGRRGTPATRAHIDEVRDQFLKDNPGYKQVGGGTDKFGNPMKEEYLPSANGGKKGSAYPDLTFEDANGNRARVNTVDTKASGDMTTREFNNKQKIEKLTGEKVYAVPKDKTKGGQTPWKQDPCP
jgi:RHS repeat-associated protein